MKGFTIATILLLTAAAQVKGQRTYLAEPELVWTVIGGETGERNGVYLTPDGSTLVTTFLDGSLGFYQPDSGATAAPRYVPDSRGLTIRGRGGVAFYTGENPYMVYAITDNPFDPATAQTRVIGVSPTGSKLFETAPAPGIQAGTPMTSADGRYVYMNHNERQAVGHFSIYDTTQLVGDLPLNHTYRYTNETNPFSPLGGYHRPAEGYYDGGQGNTNDIFVWAYDTAGDAATVGVGQIFAFQMPNDGSPMTAITLGADQGFQSSTSPQLTNSGRSLYWSVTRAEQRCWVGSATTNANRFNRGRTQTVGLRRGSPTYVAGKAPPSFSSNTVQPIVYGPGAAPQVWRMDYNYSIVTTVDTTSLVSSKIAVSPDDLYIYYATQDGFLLQADGLTLDTIWTVNLRSAIPADIALNADGTIVYAVDSVGAIRAYRVATVPNQGPVATPTPPTSITPVPQAPVEVPPPVDAPVPTTPESSMPSDVPSIIPAAPPSAASSSSYLGFLIPVILGLLI